MLGRLFSNLMKSSEYIAVAMTARGFAGPKEHNIVVPGTAPFRILPNLLAVLLLSACVAGCMQRIV